MQHGTHLLVARLLMWHYYRSVLLFMERVALGTIVASPVALHIFRIYDSPYFCLVSHPWLEMSLISFYPALSNICTLFCMHNVLVSWALTLEIMCREICFVKLGV